MIITSLDLEMNQPSGKIIQIGACVGNTDTKEILVTFDAIVRIKEDVNPYITQLTGITNKMVQDGVDLEFAYYALSEMHKEYGSFINPLTWGGGDSQELLNQLEIMPEWVFGRRWIDAKTLFVSMQIARGLKPQGGLARSMTKVGLKFEGRKHNAKDDAVNTFRMYCAMLDLLKVHK